MLRLYMASASTCSFISFFFSSRRRHTRSTRDWSSDVCSSDLRSLAKRRAGSPFVGQPQGPELRVFARAKEGRGGVLLAVVLEGDSHVVGQKRANGTELSILRKSCVRARAQRPWQPRGLRVVERAERPHPEEARRVTEFDLPGLGPGVDRPPSSSEVRPNRGNIVFADE